MGILKWGALFFIGMIGFNHAAISEELPWKTLTMATVVESHSMWTPQNTQIMLDRANNILSQCRISVEVQAPAILYLGMIAMDYDSIGLANQFYNQLQKPILFLIQSTQYNGSAGWAPGSKYLFVSSYSLSKEYKNVRHKDYEILAHELGHMLGGLPHLTGDDQNLMAGYIENQSASLTKDQCQKMRTSDQFPNENYF